MTSTKERTHPLVKITRDEYLDILLKAVDEENSILNAYYNGLRDLYRRERSGDYNIRFYQEGDEVSYVYKKKVIGFRQKEKKK